MPKKGTIKFRTIFKVLEYRQKDPGTSNAEIWNAKKWNSGCKKKKIMAVETVEKSRIVEDAGGSSSEKSNLTTLNAKTVEKHCNKESTKISKESRYVKWGLMPTEILVRVFSHVLMASQNPNCLIRCGKVCKQWNYASSHPSLWKRIDLSFMAASKKANDRTLAALVDKKGIYILELNLAGWSKLTDKGIMAVAEKCQNLEAVGLSNCVKSTGRKNISLKSLLKLIENCNLKKVDISWLPTDSCANKIIRSLCDQQGAQLESLNLCGCPIGFSALQFIQASSRNLRVLDLSNTRVYQLNIEKLQIGCPSLEELYMANLSLDFTKCNSKDQESSAGFPNLTALSINTFHLTDNILQRLLKNASSLKLLDLRQCVDITEKGLEKLSASSIEQLFLSKGRSISALDSILRKWGDSLIQLDLSWVSSSFNSSCFDDDRLQQIIQSNLKMEKLSTLDLSGSPISDTGLRYILYLCPNLNELNLTSCKGVSRGWKRKHDKASIDDLRK